MGLMNLSVGLCVQSVEMLMSIIITDTPIINVYNPGIAVEVIRTHFLGVIVASTDHL